MRFKKLDSFKDGYAAILVLFLRSNGQFREVGLITRILVIGKEFRLSSLHFTHDMIQLHAFLEEIGNISALSVLKIEFSSIGIGTLDHHSLIGVAGQFIINLVISEIEFD